MDLPERFRGDSDDGEDGSKASDEHPETFVQQSVYGIIAAAQSRGFRTLPTLELDSASGSGSENEEVGSTRERDDEKTREFHKQAEARQARSVRQPGSTYRSSVGHQRKTPTLALENRLFASVLNPVSRSSSSSPDRMSQSQILPEASNPRKRQSPRKRLSIRWGTEKSTKEVPSEEAVQVASGSDQTVATPQPNVVEQEQESYASTAPVSLSQALADIFHFNSPEDVISEHPCWYLQSVLLQGHLYITKRHVCFYAYLPKKGNIVKSGYLTKQGKRSSRYRRHWFTLKAGVFSYYSSAAEPFFPSGTIDLRFANAAELTPEKTNEDPNNISTFTITTDKRTYYFRAESPSSAREWVRQLQKVIFRSHSDGDSIKISMPIEDIVDVEPNPILDMAETVKIRVIDSEQTYAVDEYFFTFFSNGKSALEHLVTLAEANGMAKTRSDPNDDEGFTRSTKLARQRLSASAAMTTEPVRQPMGSFRSRLDRPSANEIERSVIDPRTTQASSSRSTRAVQESEDCFVTPSEQGDGSPIISPSAEVDMSASQMLLGDGAFRSPTFRSKDPQHRLPQPIFGDDPSSSEVPATGSSDSESEAGMARRTSRAPRRVPSMSGIEPDSEKMPTLDQTSGLPLRAIATPLQHAFTIADVVRTQGRKMSSYLSSSPKNYYERFSGALAGGKRHYSEAGVSGLDDDVEDPELDLETAEHDRRFQQHFALSNNEKLRAAYYCSLHRVLPLYGKVYISDRRFCFRSLLYGTRTKLVVPFTEIDNIAKEKGFRWGYPGMVLIIRGHEELFFDFGSADARDDCVVTVLRTLDAIKSTNESVILSAEEKADAGAAAAENEALQDARKMLEETSISSLQESVARPKDGSPVTFDDPSLSLVEFRPKESLRITCLTIGSRGDVQPYIALCKGLIKEGHRARIATHTQFGDWIKGHGIDFAPVVGDPAELMRICVENGMFTPSFLYEANSKFRNWLDGLLESAWEACGNSDLLIESPSAMAGIHIAEALGIPYFRAFTMPWTKTRAYPHAFAMRGKRMGGQYNYTSYTIFDYVFWQAIATQINRWRRKTLELKSTDYTKMQSNKVPFLYNFSPSVVPPPLDFSDWIRITGYWFLDEGDGWQPPSDLVNFMKQARKDDQKLVYIGFGSVPVSDSRGLTQQIVDAVLHADVRCILSKGWSDHFSQDQPSLPAVALPPSIFEIRSAPHDWLFKQIDAAVHHGGAGTTGASLRAGVPTVVKPFFGDQFFFATRVEDLGVGIHLQKITVKALGKAIWCATHDERMRTKARVLGEKIRSEDGVATAIKAIYRDLDYAKTLIKKRENATTATEEGTDMVEDEEESWTFVENESDVDVTGVRRGSESSGVQAPQPLYHHGLTSIARRSGLGAVSLRGFREQ